MRYPGRVSWAAICLVTWLVAVIFSPVIVVAGEPVNRYVMRRVHWRAARVSVTGMRRDDLSASEAVPMRLPLPASPCLMVISNPLWIALTAPGRWVSDRFRHRMHVDHG